MKAIPRSLVRIVTAVSLLWMLWSTPASAQNASIRDGELILKTHQLMIDYHLSRGTMDVAWADGHRLDGIESAVELADGRTFDTTMYAVHRLLPGRVPMKGTVDFVISSQSSGKPTLFQHVQLAEDKPWFTLRLELDPVASRIGTRHIDGVLVKGQRLLNAGTSTSLRYLHVPFDNDMWFRYASVALSDLAPSAGLSSNEVTAIYDDTSRQGLIVGSIDHDTWKTALDVHAQAGVLSELDVYGGIASPTGVRTDTHDTVPHGIVSGLRVESPRIFIGSFSDWRDGMEVYGAANAMVHPPLRWGAGAPMGWNSWAAYADKIDFDRYLGAARYMHDTLVPEGFRQKRTVYINLDAFWSRLDAVQLAAAVSTIKAMRAADGAHFEPGIYWTPFAYWSDNLDAWVEGTGMKYRYRDILLRGPDGRPLPKVDGGWALDPSHPGTLERIRFSIRQFEKMGFTYLKLDFLSHGTLEGRHYDPKIQTGIQAYNEGMREIVRAAGGNLFLSLSIAPLFPSGYGHARRLSCDTKGHISGNQSTEYMLNSLTYGWWTAGSLYIADPDHVVLGKLADQGARSVTEGRSRLLSAVISGGMILDSSRLADDPQSRSLARQVYGSRSLLAIAEQHKVFRPLDGDTGDRASPVFVNRDGDGYLVAVFNFDDHAPKTIHVPLARIHTPLAGATDMRITNVADGEAFTPVNGVLAISLQPAESKLISIVPGASSK